MNSTVNHTVKPEQTPNEPLSRAADDASTAAQTRADTPTQPSGAIASPEKEVASLQEQLAAAEAKATEHYDQFLRARAEMENIRRRASEDVAKAHRYGVESFATELLAVKDSLEAALATPSTTIEQMRDGVELTLKQLAQVLEKFSVREVDPTGEKFDPNKHMAMTALESDKPANTVINVLQKGYTLHDRVLRPALVTVAKAKD